MFFSPSAAARLGVLNVPPTSSSLPVSDLCPSSLSSSLLSLSPVPVVAVCAGLLPALFTTSSVPIAKLSTVASPVSRPRAAPKTREHCPTPLQRAPLLQHASTSCRGPRRPYEHVSALTRCARRRQFSQTLNAIRPRNPRRRFIRPAPPVCDAENRLLTMLKVNARFLTKSPEKSAGLFILLERKRFPDLVAVTELGCGPEMDKRGMKSFLGVRICSKYSVHFRTRTCSHLGGAIGSESVIGGGVMLLVRKSLCADVRKLPVHVPDHESRYVNGHIGVWRLSPKQPVSQPAISGQVRPRRPSRPDRRLHRTVIASVLYVPPGSCQNWSRHRDLLIRAVRASELAINKLRRVQDAFHVVLAHLNAQDGGSDVPLVLDGGKARLRALHTRLASVSGAGSTRCPPIGRLLGGDLVLRRSKCRRARKSTKQGRSITNMFSQLSMVPLNGAFSGRQPTTFRPCAKCAGNRRCQCRASRMVNVNDYILVPADSIADTLFLDRSLWPDLSSRRIDWAPSLDHGVTTAHVRIGRPVGVMSDVHDVANDFAGCAPLPCGRRPRILHLPSNLLERRRVLDEAALQFKALVSASSPLPVSLNALSSTLTRCIRLAHERAIDAVCGGSTSNVSLMRRTRLARNELRRGQHILSLALRSRAVDGRTAAVSIRIKAASAAVRRATSKFKRAVEDERLSSVQYAHLHDPKDMWVRLEELAAEQCAPTREPCALLQRLNNKDGELITIDKSTIHHHLHRHRTEVFQLSNNLGAVCEERIDIALHVNSLLNNDEMVRQPGLDASSAAALSAADALAPMAAADVRRRHIRTRFNAADFEAKVTPILERIATKKRETAAHAEALHRDISLEELRSVTRDILESGSGTDSICAAILRRFPEEALQDLLLVLRLVWTTGKQPDDWSSIRCLLYFKKGDEFYVENYRGLGISCHLPKLLDLIMAKRLETFIIATKALSASQGGFLPHRGTPEQVITLTESIRSVARQNRAVYACFVDIRRAYDSVVHALLWQCCAEAGIGGRFLTTLQARYHNVEAVLDLDGETLPPVRVECGVIQGSPLSCLLFNLYIDAAIRALELECRDRIRDGRTLSGIPLPRRGPATRTLPPDQWTELDRLISLFFADDGALLAFDKETLQEMVNVLESALCALGFALNASKTECMVFPPLRAGLDVYTELKSAADDEASPFVVAGEAVVWSDTFRYLGTIIWWRLDWTLEWKHAQQRVRNGLRLFSSSGMHKKGLSPAQLYKYVQNKALCYLNRPSTISGAGGSASSAPWSENDGLVVEALRTIMCDWNSSHLTLCGEFGVCDARTRIDLLVLRQCAKITACARDSTHFRALCLSADSLTQDRRAGAATKDAAKGRTHHQPWIQQVVAAASRFGIDAPYHGLQFFDVSEARMGLVGLQVVEADGSLTHVFDAGFEAHTFTFINIEVADREAVAALSARVDLESLQLNLYDLRDSQRCWPLPAGTRFADALLWSPTLHDATFAILDYLGRQCALRVSHSACAAVDVSCTQLQRYLAIKPNHALRMEMYLNLPARFARSLYNSRADNQHNEESARRRLLQPFNSKKSFDRIPNHLLRPCYNCRELAPLVYHCESLAHVLLRCSVFEQLRAEFRAAVSALIIEVHGNPAITFADIPAPDMNNDTAFMMLARCATASNPLAVLMPAIIANPTPVQARSNPPYHHDPAVAAATASWLRIVSAVARRRYAGAYEVFVVRSAADPALDRASSVCNRLIECIARFNARIFSQRHALLRDNAEFAGRTRDPPRPPRPGPAAGQPVPPAPP